MENIQLKVAVICCCYLFCIMERVLYSLFAVYICTGNGHQHDSDVTNIPLEI